MSYNPKYQFSFYDLLGAKCTVQLAFNNYLGAVNTLVGGVSPVIISHSGDDSNPFDPIRASKCNLAIKIDANCGLLISDLQDIDDTTILANITISTGKSFVGWVTPDQTTRNFSLDADEIKLICIDLFSIMKNKDAVKSDNSIFFGLQNLMDYLKTLYNSGTANAFGLNYNVKMPYTLDPTAFELSNYNLLQQVQVMAESFNDNNGRALKSYDVVSKILQSVFCYSFMENGTLNILNPATLDTTKYKTVFIQSRSVKTNTLLGNTEQISYTRGLNELKCKMSYSSDSGFITDAFFQGWNGNLLTEWERQSTPSATAPALIQRKGNLRIESNAGAYLQYTDSFSSYYQAPRYLVIKSKGYRVLKGQTYKLDINLTYQDYTKWDKRTVVNYGIQPQISVLDDGNHWHELKSIKWDDGDTIFKQLTPSDEQQSVSVDIPEIPESGMLYVFLTAIRGDIDYYSPERYGVTYKSVILSTTTNKSGETDYLTQSKSYSLKKDDLQTYLDNVPETISGALFTGITYMVGTNFVLIGSLLKRENIYKKGETVPKSLMHQLLRAYMATARSPKAKISFDILSNEIFFGDLLKFDNNIMPNIYMQMSNEYDVKNCTQKISAIEVNNEFLPSQIDGYADSTKDLYEHYNTTG